MRAAKYMPLWRSRAIKPISIRGLVKNQLPPAPRRKNAGDGIAGVFICEGIGG
jgi:hypothetical protein